MKMISGILALFGSISPALFAQNNPSEFGATSGKVVTTDGSSAPSGLSIVRTCGVAASRTVAHTDAKGHFSFMWGASEGVFQDASDDGAVLHSGSAGVASVLNDGTTGRTQNSNLSLSLPASCELKVDAPGFSSDVVRLHAGDVGTIVLRRLANANGTSVSATSLAAPADARKAYEKGLDSAAKGKSVEAQKNLKKAVAVYPKYANAWLELGRERLKAHLDGPAHDAFVRALAADNKLVAADAELGMMAAEAQNWKEAASYLDATMRLDPADYPQLRLPAAVAEYNVQNFEAAEMNAREALKNDPAHPNPRPHELLGVLLLNKGDFKGSIEELRAYLKLAPTAPDTQRVKTLIQEAESGLASATGGGSAAPSAAH